MLLLVLSLSDGASFTVCAALKPAGRISGAESVDGLSRDLNQIGDLSSV